MHSPHPLIKHTTNQPTTQGLANELSLCPPGKTCGGKMNAVMIMRFYTSGAQIDFLSDGVVGSLIALVGWLISWLVGWLIG